MRNAFILLLMLASPPSMGQVTVVPIKKYEFSFPFIKSSNKTIAQKINHYLQHEILLNESPKTEPLSIFEGARFISNDSVDQSGFTYIEYYIIVNSSKILSIEFIFETMGAYPDSYMDYHSFDLKSGEPVASEKIFTKDGLEQIGNRLLKLRQKEIDLAMKDSLYREDAELTRETFSECNAEADADHIFIQKNSILFYKGYCFPHAERAMDIPLDIELSFNELRKYFTDEGKLLLIGAHNNKRK